MLILTDFSEAAFRAAEYGCQIAGNLHIERIILFHAYQSVMAATGLPVAEINDQQLYLENMEALGLLQDRIKPLVDNSVTIDMLAEDSALMNAADLIQQFCRKEDINLVVMGVSEKSAYEHLLLGSMTAEILKSSEVPVLIVPEDILLGRRMQSIVFASDLTDIDATPTVYLYEFLEALPAKLYVINVQPETGKQSAEMEKRFAGISGLLDGFNPSFHTINGEDVVETILAFAKEHQASLIIAIHQKHGFWSGLFHKSVTKKLAYNSRIPLLALPGLG